jgi:hypothetical protein
MPPVFDDPVAEPRGAAAGRIISVRPHRNFANRIPQIFSKTNFINPSFEQRHRMTYAVPCGHGFFLVAEEFLANVLRATGGAKPVLRTMPR